MKHSLHVTLLLAAMFFLAQLIGVLILDTYVTTETIIVDNVTTTTQTWAPLPYNLERPEFEEETSYIPLITVILAATGLALILIKFKAFTLWKLWFFLSVWFCLLVALKIFFGAPIAFLLAVLFAILKVFTPNIYTHNLTELFIYAGLAVVFVPILTIGSAAILLILIAIYDAIAVWKTKHMVSLAQFQSKLKLFAGFMIPYKNGKHTAILGGGDIGFPLLFTGAVMKLYGLSSIIISITVTLSLLALLFLAEKGRFYPAMPFLAAGCFVGYGVLLLV